MSPRKIPDVPSVAIKVGIPKVAIAIELIAPRMVPMMMASAIGKRRFSGFHSKCCMSTTAV